MIKVISGNSVSKKELILAATTTIMTACEEAGLDVSRSGITLNGSMLVTSDFNKTFADFGVTEKCHLLQVIKADNA